MATSNATVIICIWCEGRLIVKSGSRPTAGSALCPECGAAYTWYRVAEGIALHPIRNTV